MIEKIEIKETYTLEEVRLLLEEQKKRMCFTLGLSSAIYTYPKDYQKIVDWMMKCRLVV